jgi:elongation factor P
MKINAVQIRPGNVLEHKNKLWAVSKIMHTQPGKGGAYMQVEMKDIKTGTKLNERFRSDETVERARLDQKDYQYLYDEGETLALMDQESFEQISVDKSLFGDAIVFLQDGMKIIVELHEEKPVSATLPDYVTLQIVEAEPVVKGQTASSSYKPAILENGVRIMVPPFIESGTKVVVNTATQEYFERAKA